MLKPSRRPKSVAIGVVVLAALLGLAGCGAPSNAPSEYDARSKENFIDGCTATSPEPETTIERSGASAAYCECAYNWFVDNIPFDQKDPARFDGATFTGLNKTLSDKPEEMPQAIKDALAGACGSSDQPKTGPTTPTTVAAADDSASTTTSVAG